MFETKKYTTETMVDLFDQIMGSNATAAYPPYNVINYGPGQKVIVEVALAGFTSDEINVESRDNGHTLVISGEKQKAQAQDGVQFVRKGISTKKFKHTFRIAAHNYDIGEAEFKDGLLTVTLSPKNVTVPEAVKIPIKGQKQFLAETNWDELEKRRTENGKHF